MLFLYMNPFFLEYIWVDGVGELHSKIKVLYDFNQLLTNPSEVPRWNYDGSSTGQAEGNNSEITLIPRALFNNPHRENSMIVLCDTWAREHPIEETNHEEPLIPALYNNRNYATTVFENETVVNHEPWYGLEQEYFLRPCGFTDENFKHILETYHLTMPGRAYCGIGRGAIHTTQRTIVEEHMDACIKAGITISGINAEVAPFQWEFQVGPCEGIKAADQLWVARYLLHKIAEKHMYEVILSPKIDGIDNAINGSGCHTNFSTKYMREACSSHNAVDALYGIPAIKKAIKNLESKHDEHMAVYGEGNNLRMTGKCETADYNTFSYGVGSRTVSIRIPNDVYTSGEGYFEDRRPASNNDPYLVTAILAKTVIIDDNDH
jgi:glutamine synthetase